MRLAILSPLAYNTPMLDTKTGPASLTQPHSLSAKIAIGLIVLYQALALLLFAVTPILSAGWIRTPFLGVFVENTMVSNGVGPQSGDWAAYNNGMNMFGVGLQAVDGKNVRSAGELQRVLQQYDVGETVTLTIRPPNAETTEIDVPLANFPFRDQLAFFYIPFLIGIVYLGSGLWVFSLRRNDASGRVFAVFATSVAIALGALFDTYTVHAFTYLWTFAMAMVGGSLFMLALLFPHRSQLIEKRPWSIWLSLLPVVVLMVIAFPRLYNLNNPLPYADAWAYEFLYVGLAIFSYLGWTASQRYRSQSPIVREQARIILIGALLAFIPIGIWFLLASTQTISFRPEVLITLVAFPLATAYAILRYRLLNTDYILSRGVSYALLTVLSVAIYTFLVWGSSLVLGTGLRADHPILIGMMVLFLSIGLNPLRERLQKQVDAVFFRGRTIYETRSREFGRELTQLVDLNEIIHLLRTYVNEAVMPSQNHIFLYDSLSDQYYAAGDDTGNPTTDIRFSASGGLAQTISASPTSVFLSDAANIPASLMSDKARLALLKAQLFVALPGQQQLAGWVGLGSPRSGAPFGRQALAYIESLCAQAALAIERAQVVYDLERRVHEMNVLGRIAQGVNVTLNFDDLLELIYAQTNQVVPTKDFRIMLYNKRAQHSFHAFFLEGDDRLSERENVPLREGKGLEHEVIRTQRAITTDDYERECQGRGALPDATGLYAWMGVPLTTGADTIGAISLGSKDPSTLYTIEQQSLFQSIADQAAGAIIKTQLLQEAEERARQLTSLNQVARSLSSNLDLSPLLNQILESAVNILNCEAGSLVLVDEETQELVFEVMVSPVADSLRGMRLPPGTGLAGQAVDAKTSIIDNNVQKNREWFGDADEQTGFISREMMVVPMMVQDEVLGVVQVINKRNGDPFTDDDEQLLSAFTGQAAVAIQNARLFTMTDQALSDRVEELSVMQRIDRELNVSLDTERALQIALEWAIRQSKLSAGFAASYSSEDAPTLLVAATHRYDRAALTQERLFSMDIINQVIESQESLAMVDMQDTILPNANYQVVLPLQREKDVIGILFLESTTGPLDEETYSFLVRLGDHSAIAVANAQLYAAVQAANLAKSDFVSFVSHELKNPMTSIRGYTDLLSAGAVGPITETQSNFLETIRSNVNRMATLVTDLADVSRIEAGRLRLDFGEVRVSEVVDEVVRSLQSQFEDKNQRLQINIPDDLPKVWGDHVRLVQVMTNLVSNAHKYTPEDGEILVQADLLPEREQPRVRVLVKDDGIGMTPEDKRKIFTKFFRSEDQKAREAPGTGLGLNITKNLVEMQDGKIWFESEFRQGTTFYFTIPVAETQ